MTSDSRTGIPAEEAGMSRRAVLGSSLAAAGAGAIGRMAWRRRRAPIPATCGALARTYVDEEVDQSLGVSLPGPDVVARLPQAGEGRRLRRHRAELRPRERPLAEGRPRRASRDPQGWPRRSASPSAASARSSTGPTRSPTTTRPAAPAASSWPGMMIEAAHELGTSNLLTIAGSTYIPWLPDREPVAIRRLRPPRPRGDRQAAARWPRRRASRSTSRTSSSTAT